MPRMKSSACVAVAMALLAGPALAREATREVSWLGDRHPGSDPPCAPDEYKGHASFASARLANGGRRLTRLSVRLESRLLRDSSGAAQVTVFVRAPRKKPHLEIELVPGDQGWDPASMRTGDVVMPRGAIIDVPKGNILTFQSTGVIVVGATTCSMPVAVAEFSLEP